MKKPALAIATLLAMIFLPGESFADIEKLHETEAKNPIRIAAGSKSRVMTLRRFKTKFAAGDAAGVAFWGRWCEPRGIIPWGTGVFGDLAPRATKVFREELVKAGYVVAGDPDSLFDETSEVKAELDVGALVTDMTVTHCSKSVNGDALGGVFMKVKWQAYSPLAKRVIFEVVTEGSSQNLDKPDLLRVSDRVMNAFAVAVRNLLADKGFYDTVTAESAPVATATRVAYQINRPTILSDGVTKNISVLRNGVATVVSGSISGSAFFISQDGYLLTNQHVVRDSRYVKVKLLTGRELVGEVVATSTVYDIALLKTEPVEVAALSIRDSEPNIGDVVYLLGSPLGEKFQASLTKGILSGYREFEGIRFLQSDVSALPGNSGGPLLDDKGAVIGIARLGGGTAGGHLNLFIPIDQALSQMGVEFK